MDGFQEGSSSLHLQRSTFFLCVAARRSIANFYQPGTTKGPAGALGRVFQVVNWRENRFCAITAYGFTRRKRTGRWDVESMSLSESGGGRGCDDWWRLKSVKAFYEFFCQLCCFCLSAESIHSAECLVSSFPILPVTVDGGPILSSHLFSSKHPVNYNNGINDVPASNWVAEASTIRLSYPPDWGIYQTVASHARCFWIWRCSLRGHHVTRGFSWIPWGPWIP